MSSRPTTHEQRFSGLQGRHHRSQTVVNQNSITMICFGVFHQKKNSLIASRVLSNIVEMHLVVIIYPTAETVADRGIKFLMPSSPKFRGKMFNLVRHTCSSTKQFNLISEWVGVENVEGVGMYIYRIILNWRFDFDSAINDIVYMIYGI